MVRSNYVRKYDAITLRVRSTFLDYFLWYACITYWNNIRATIRSRLSLWRIFITSQLHYLYVPRVKIFYDVRITLNYRNRWHVWSVYGSYVIKWPFFNYIIFLAPQLFDNLFWCACIKYENNFTITHHHSMEL